MRESETPAKLPQQHEGRSRRQRPGQHHRLRGHVPQHQADGGCNDDDGGQRRQQVIMRQRVSGARFRRSLKPVLLNCVGQRDQRILNGDHRRQDRHANGVEPQFPRAGPPADHDHRQKARAADYGLIRQCQGMRSRCQPQQPA